MNEPSKEKPPSPRRLSILDAAITAIKTNGEWTTAHVAEICSVPKSVVYHYFESKADLVHSAFDRYVTQARAACDIAFDLAMWVAMRNDALLAYKVRAQRIDQRGILKIEFDGELEAWLAQALHVGLGIMRETGFEVDETEIKNLFRELVFENHVRNRAPEVKAGIDQELAT